MKSRHYVLLTCIAVAGSMLSSSPCDGVDNIPVKEVLRQWRQREANIRSFRVTWSKTVSFPKAVIYPLLMNSKRQSQEAPSNEELASLVTYDLDCLIAGQRHYFKHTFSGKLPYQGLDGAMTYEESTHVSTFDGVMHATLRLPISTRQYPSGQLEDSTDCPDYSDTTLRPLLWWCRPTDKSMLGSVDESTALSEMTDLDGEPCIHITWRKEHLLQEIWVAVRKEFNVVRYISNDDQRTDVVFEQKDGLGWFPASWRTESHPGSDTRNVIASGRVTSCTINPSFPRDEFTIVFPPGTLVTDNLRAAGEGRYIVRRDGTKRMITPEEIRLRMPYDQLIATERPDAP